MLIVTQVDEALLSGGFGRVLKQWSPRYILKIILSVAWKSKVRNFLKYI